VTATSSHLLWYSTRATGVVALVLLTASVVLGVLTSVRFGTPDWPRFALQDLHKRVSMLSVVFVGLHVVTTVSDAYAPIGWLSVFVPFSSPYRRIWLGLGSVAFDLLLAVTISSLLRQRISQRVWRGLHWLAYASWPVALVHGLGTGTDPRLGWMLALTVICVTAVLSAIGWRLVSGWPARAGARVLVGAGSVLGVAAIALWSAAGPLRPGWSARAGTPASLLAGANSASSTTSDNSGHPSGYSGTDQSTTLSSLPAPPYQANIAGSVSRLTRSGGLEQLEMKAQTQGALDAVLDVLIVGNPGPSGGVVMQTSEVSFGPPAAPGEYQGSVAGLDGSRILLALHDSAGDSLDLRLDVSITGTDLTGQLDSIGTVAGGISK